MAPLTDAGGPGLYELDAVTLGVPLLVKLGVELDEVTASLKTQLTNILELLILEGATSDADADGLKGDGLEGNGLEGNGLEGDGL